MKIKNIGVENFRLLKNSCLDMTDGMTLVVGKNNTGKTSFVVLLERFLTKANPLFNYSDLPVSLRSELITINPETNIDQFSIRLRLCIEYGDGDNLKNISEFMLDLDPTKTTINILFEARIDKNLLLEKLPKNKDGDDDATYEIERKIFIEKNIGRFIKTYIYAYDDSGYSGEKPYYIEKRVDLEEKEFKQVSKLLNFQVIHARRNVSSSDENGRSPLSSVTTQFFKKLTDSDDECLNGIRSALIGIDKGLQTEYATVFSDFLSNASGFLNLEGLKVVSDIEASALIGTSSKVIYGTSEDHLPENFNGLGYLNIIYLLLKLEIAKKEFEATGSDINILCVEEPEAHTHPQMQSVFSRKIRELVRGINGLQTIISTHSSYIVATSAFDDIRYIAKVDKENVIFKNFHTDLAKKYHEISGQDGSKLYQFLEQYLKIQNAELFFADKAIFIEGTTERILLPLFVKEFDKTCHADNKLSEQNISIIEAGANAKAFAPFLNFIGIKTLIITDLDTTKKKVKPNAQGKDITTYDAHSVAGASHTSNETLKYFLDAPAIDNQVKFSEWFEDLKSAKLEVESANLKIVYQIEEGGYHARSFEDAFLSSNKQEIKRIYNDLLGLKNKYKIDDIETADIYSLTDSILDKKSDFAASVLYKALIGEAKWITPKYIKDGLEWISQ